MSWVYSSILVIFMSIFFVSCGKPSPEDVPPEPPETEQVDTSAVKKVIEDKGPVAFEMVVHDEDNESDADTPLGKEKFFVVQQELSSGSVALFVADNHTYDASYIPDFLLEWLGGDTLADKAQSRIKSILVDHGNALKEEVCEEDSVQERRRVLMNEGLTKGTLVLISPGNTWVTYMNDTLSDGFFDGYQVSIIDRDVSGLVTTVQLSKYGQTTSTVIEGGNSVDVSRPIEERNDFRLKLLEGAQAWKSPIDLNQYLAILNEIQGHDGQFSSCSQ